MRVVLCVAYMSMITMEMRGTGSMGRTAALRLKNAAALRGSSVLNSRMPLILILIILLLLVGGGGAYMGPGVGYYGGGVIDIIIALVILYLIFGRGRSRL